MGFIFDTLHPDIYHGRGKKAPFFEGWYFKLVSADQQQRYAIIPGVILSGEPHAFVQVLNGVTGKAHYFEFPLQAFRAEFADLRHPCGTQPLYGAIHHARHRHGYGRRSRGANLRRAASLAGALVVPGDYGLVRLDSVYGVLPRRGQL